MVLPQTRSYVVGAINVLVQLGATFTPTPNPVLDIRRAHRQGYIVTIIKWVVSLDN